MQTVCSVCGNTKQFITLFLAMCYTIMRLVQRHVEKILELSNLLPVEKGCDLQECRLYRVVGVHELICKCLDGGVKRCLDMSRAA